LEKHGKTSVSWVRFEPALPIFERPEDHVATRIGNIISLDINIFMCHSFQI
jgi:hypothetical protein